MQSVTAPVVGIAEVAAMAGVKPKTVSGYVARGVVLPEPLARLACGPVWDRAVIEAWVAARDGKARERVVSVYTRWDALLDRAVAVYDVPEFRRSEQARRNVNNGRVARVAAGVTRSGRASGSVSKYRNLRYQRPVKAEFRNDVEERLRERMAGLPEGQRILRQVELADMWQRRLTRRAELRLGITS